MSLANIGGKKGLGRLGGVLLCRGVLLTMAGCGVAGVALAVGAGLVVGIWIGQINVSFPQDSAASGRSDLSGEARVKIQEDADGNPELGSYAGVLPGFVELGATNATVDLDAGTVTGTVTEPSGATHSLAGILPGLQASRENKAGATSQTRDGNAVAFTVQFTSGDTTYIYELSFTLQTDAAGTTLTGDVTVRRQTIQNGIVILNEFGTGSLTANQATEPEFNQELPPALPPILVDAGQNVAIEAGASTTLQASATGGSGALTYSWTPTTSLDDATRLQPTASPTVTTVYSLVVTDAAGQQAHDSVTVTVSGTPLGPSPIVVEAGEDRSVVLGGSVKLEAEASGGVGVLTYSWDPPTGLDDPTLLQPTASPAATTTYRLTVTDSQGQQGQDEVSVVVVAPPSSDVMSFQVYYNGSLYNTIDFDTDGTGIYVAAGDILTSQGTFFGVFVDVAPDASYTWYSLMLAFDNESDATGSMAATEIKGYIGVGYYLFDSSNPGNVSGDYDNSDIYVPLGPTPLITPTGTVDLRHVDGRIVGLFDVTVTQQRTPTSPVNTVRWVGTVDLPDTFKDIGGLITTGL